MAMARHSHCALGRSCVQAFCARPALKGPYLRVCLQRHVLRPALPCRSLCVRCGLMCSSPRAYERSGAGVLPDAATARIWTNIGASAEP